MSELLLLDWDDRQVRLLACTASSGGLRVHRAATAPLEGEASAATIAHALRPLLADHHPGKAKVIVVLGGRDVQSRLLRVPPVPPEELPDIVRLRAGTEFPVGDDSAVIDFVPLDEVDGQTHSVFAARLPERALARAREVCEKLHLTASHVTVRGCGVAALSSLDHQVGPEGVALIAMRRGDELDLVGTRQGAAAVLRTVAMPGDADSHTLGTTVAREIRRTIAAVSSELGVGDVDQLVWLVGDDADKRVAGHCSEVLDRRVSLVDIQSLAQSKEPWPEGAASLAGMLGAATSIASGGLPVDFLDPRKPPEKTAPTVTYALAGVLAALVLLGGGWMMYRSVASLEQAAAADIEERETIEADIEQLTPERQQAAEVEQWLATDVNWLDELDHIAVTLRPQPLDNHEQFEPDRDVRLTSLVAKQAPGRRGAGGTLELAGGVRDDAVLEQIENELREPGRQVNPKSMVNDSQNAPYVWSFQSDIVVTPPQEERQ